MKKINVLAIAVLLSGAGFAQTNWAIDKSHSKIGFVAKHLVITEVEGYFKEYDGKVSSTSDDFNGATIEFTAKTASVFTDEAKRDNHLKSDDFFNSEKFPDLKFAGTLSKDGDKYVLKGNLTIRDVTKPVSLEVTYGGKVKAFGGERAGFKIKGKINRKDYGLKFNAAFDGGMIVGEEVEINVKTELTKS